MPSLFRGLKPALVLSFALASLLPHVASATESSFVYENVNPDRGANLVAALRVVSGGAASIVPGSPFATGGNGLASTTGAEFAHRIASCEARSLLFAANDGSGTISVFEIETGTGVIRAVPGSPFNVGWSAFAGISLTPSKDCRTLYASGPNIVSLAVAESGALSVIGARWSFTQRAAGIAVNPDSSRLFLSMSGGVAILHSGEGGLTADPPQIVSIGTSATDLGLDSSGTWLYVGTRSGGIQAYRYDAGSLQVAPGAPFFSSLPEIGGIAIDHAGRFLVAYSPLTPRLLAARTNADGSLTLSPGSPLAPPLTPVAGALSPAATLLFTADAVGQLDVWSAAADGSLAHLPGYPFLTGAGPGFPSLATFVATNPVPSAPGPWLAALAALLLLSALLALRRNATR